ncbi:hypothetical protein ACHQM5_017306 [Ranunculus cassubicifolius]
MVETRRSSASSKRSHPSSDASPPSNSKRSKASETSNSGNEVSSASQNEENLKESVVDWKEQEIGGGSNDPVDVEVDLKESDVNMAEKSTNEN